MVRLTGGLTDVSQESALELLINWGDGTIESFGLPSGAESFEFDHTYVDDDPIGTPVDAVPINVVLRAESGAGDAATVTTSLHNLAPSLWGLDITPSARNGDVITLTGEVSDPGMVDVLTLTIDWGDGTIGQSGIGQGNASLTGTHVYAEAGTYNVAVTVADDDGGEATEFLGVTVSANAAPVAGNDAFALVEDGELVIDAPGLLGNDTDPDGDPLLVEFVTGATYGVLSLGQDGSFTYVPDADFNGTDSFAYRASDGWNRSGIATVTITVNPVNDAPAFVAGDSQTLPEDSGPQIIPDWATGMSAGPPDEAGQTLCFIAGNDHNVLFSVQPTIAPDGTLTFTPAENATGSVTVTVVLKDDGGTELGGMDTSSPQIFTITLTPVNDAPVIRVIEDKTVAEGSTLSLMVDAFDPDLPFDTLTFTLDEGPAGATIDPTTGLFTWAPAMVPP